MAESRFMMAECRSSFCGWHGAAHERRDDFYCPQCRGLTRSWSTDLERHYTIDAAERILAKARAQRAIDEHDARFDALNAARMAMHAAEAHLATARDRVKRCRVAKTIAEELSPHDTDQRQRTMREFLSAQQAEAEAALACTEAKAKVKALREA